jgi:hypothetical protein
MATATASNRTQNEKPAAAEKHDCPVKGETHIIDDLVEYLTEYAREKPEIAALWCVGIGFMLGWKLKPW